MLRYKLDDLGWFYFEKLVQSLLKAELGLGVESWGGSGPDHGRDAYSQQKLAFPSPAQLSTGPFLFQAKFVNGANAAGANWAGLLRHAVDAEVLRIRERLISRIGRHDSLRRSPRRYVLLTNCNLTGAARAEVEQKISDAVPDVEVHTLGGSDICDILDRHPKLRNSFPELLSLRDLNALLEAAVAKPILERSRVAVEESKELVPVFVPTGAYYKARQCLQKHSFVVLDGPPEMGKTAIARMIALTRLLQGWQAVDCRNPDDVFSVLDTKEKQVFVADDAFGRTEYDPRLGRVWERDLPRIFWALDGKHQLIWTTRKHILMRAQKEMDVTGRAHGFPRPGEVIVTADNLSIEEKARMLYRHAKAAGLTAAAKDLIREHAERIVNDSHFTPERIRRFAQDVVPALSSDRTRGAQEITAGVLEAIRNPTDRMRKSYGKLDEQHKWLLLALLDCEDPVNAQGLLAHLRQRQPDLSEQTFSELLDNLLGTFIRMRAERYSWLGERVDWIHPSYRDLVIDELSRNRPHQLAFIRGASIAGIALALSRAGGRTGEREFPLLTSRESWLALSERCQDIVAESTDGATRALLDVLLGAIQVAHDQNDPNNIAELLRNVYMVAIDRLEERESIIDADLLKTCAQVAEVLALAPPTLALERTWEAQSATVLEELSRGTSNAVTSAMVWQEMIELIESSYPQFAEGSKYRQTRTRIEEALFRSVADVVELEPELADPESNRREGRLLETLAEVLEKLDVTGARNDVVMRLQGLAQIYEDNSREADDPGYEPTPDRAEGPELDVARLFSDL